MKRISILVAFIACTLFLSAQDVTKFLGIPVDGFKPEMKRALIAKGFTYDSANDCFEGEFNGNDVYVYIVTNNNKVCRIMLVDKNEISETDIKIRFNNLCYQFERNLRYERTSSESYVIPEAEDISYNITVENKRYQASYCQIPDSTKIDIRMIREELAQSWGLSSDDLNNLPEDKKKLFDSSVEIKKNIMYLRNQLNNQVWFMIDERYGRYRILMYYDNGYNQADGEDL